MLPVGRCQGPGCLRHQHCLSGRPIEVPAPFDSTSPLMGFRVGDVPRNLLFPRALRHCLRVSRVPADAVDFNGRTRGRGGAPLFWQCDLLAAEEPFVELCVSLNQNKNFV